MSEPKVYHCKRDKVPAGTIYVGRPTKWGNPYTIGVHGDREDVIRKFRDSMTDEFCVEVREELKGKSLACWCAPEACHADVLLEVAEVAEVAEEEV
jgi:hypothetical protein